MCVPNWPKVWQYREKHRKAQLDEWRRSDTTKWTAQRGAHAQYNPVIYISNVEVEAAERDCVQTGTCFKSTRVLRKYWKKLGYIVGACSGEQTVYIYAEWHVSGAIHGRPVSEKWLKQNQVPYDKL